MSDLFNNPLFRIGLCGGFLAMCVGPMLTALLFYFWYSANFKKANAWKEFAHQHGFRYASPNPLLGEYGSMTGQFEGRAISISSKARSRTLTTTIVKVKVKDIGSFFLSTGEKGILGNIYRTTGGSNMTVETSFDERLSTNSSAPELAKKILFTDKGLLVEIKALIPLELLVKDDVVSVCVRGNYADGARLLRLIRLAFHFSAVLEQNLEDRPVQ
ncbi:MAG: hypothetical protein IT311_00840 [Anaerolineales bacterium]|nr:hypothetical protein [Anaerolineales bacterium]MCZ2121422.1 hypothetical protein [Anaerolineales bacterium]